jgi:uncharacterized protein (DUF58 family)
MPVRTVVKANILLCAASLLALFVATSPAQQTSASSFSITISADQSTVKVGAPITIRILFKNTSNEEIALAKIPGDRKGEKHNLVDVRDADGKMPPETEYKQALEGKRDNVKGHVVLPMASNFTQFLKPGDVMQDNLDVTDLYDLSKPGRYTIQIERNDDISKTLVKSNVVTVTINP